MLGARGILISMRSVLVLVGFLLVNVSSWFSYIGGNIVALDSGLLNKIKGYLVIFKTKVTIEYGKMYYIY